MLKSYLTSVPFTKFIIIKDSLEEQGKPLFDFLLKFHLDKTSNNIHYFVFQNNFRRTQNSLETKSNLIFHDCCSNILGWNAHEKVLTFQELIERLNYHDIVFIDSLVHVIFQYGLPETYRLFNSLRNKIFSIGFLTSDFSYISVWFTVGDLTGKWFMAVKDDGVQQIITLMHLDLLEKDHQTDRFFEHLSTLNVLMQPNFNTTNKRIHYVYKKVGGKIVREIEEYYFENGNFVTIKVEKFDIKKLLENSTPKKVNPETLSTFKIGLNEKDKASRSQLVLPYLPKDQDSSQEGDIIYHLDEQDDWDEEDPDDDLDI